MPKKRCETCKLWQGSGSDYMAMCGVYNRRTQFDDGSSCEAHVCKTEAVAPQPEPTQLSFPDRPVMPRMWNGVAFPVDSSAFDQAIKKYLHESASFREQDLLFGKWDRQRALWRQDVPDLRQRHFIGNWEPRRLLDVSKYDLSYSRGYSGPSEVKVTARGMSVAEMQQLIHQSHELNQLVFTKPDGTRYRFAGHVVSIISEPDHNEDVLNYNVKLTFNAIKLVMNTPLLRLNEPDPQPDE